MAVVSKRAGMTFYSDANDHYSHRVRIVLAEKGAAVDIVTVNPNNKPEDLAHLNPYNTLPTLVDRELSLFETKEMMEYLDERFPHPPLLPAYPVARAQTRQYAYRVERDWTVLVDIITNDKNSEKVANARKLLRESLISIAPIFSDKPYFMSDEFTIVDVMLAPILWRVPIMGIELPEKPCKPLFNYMSRLFSREAFVLSLSDSEKNMR